jgi:hypothetical protein
MISSYHTGRSYLQQHSHIVSSLHRTIRDNFKENHISRHNLATLECALDILAKTVIRPPIFHQLTHEEGLLQLLLRTFQSFKELYAKGNKAIETVLAAATALLTQVAIHRKGRELLTATIYF